MSLQLIAVGTRHCRLLRLLGLDHSDANGIDMIRKNSQFQIPNSQFPIPNSPINPSTYRFSAALQTQPLAKPD